jgi:hypothetical protein
MSTPSWMSQVWIDFYAGSGLDTTAPDSFVVDNLNTPPPESS